MSAFDADELYRLLRSLPPHPVAPENRGFARLLPSPYVRRGQMFRLAPSPEITGDPRHRPSIVMNTDDVDMLRARFGGALGNIDQEIADIAEQLFAQQEAQGR